MLDDFFSVIEWTEKNLWSHKTLQPENTCNNRTHPANAINQEFEAQKG